MALLRILVMAAVVLFVTRWLRRYLSQPRGGRGGGFGGFGTRDAQSSSRAKLRMLKFEKKPHQILGVSANASREDVDAAWKAALEKNDPERLGDMSPEIRAVAQRRRDEINKAYREIVDEE